MLYDMIYYLSPDEGGIRISGPACHETLRVPEINAAAVTEAQQRALAHFADYLRHPSVVPIEVRVTIKVDSGLEKVCE